MIDTIHRLPSVKLHTGLSRSTIYDKLNPKSPRYDSTFPKPISLGLRAVGFAESEIHTWLEAQKQGSRDATMKQDGGE